MAEGPGGQVATARYVRLLSTRHSRALVGDGRLPRGGASDSLIYDATLQAAVRTFQQRHNLKNHSIVDAATRAAMNIPAAKRVAQIRINLERMQWISHRLPADFLLVNIPEQRVRLFRNGRGVRGSSSDTPCGPPPSFGIRWSPSRSATSGPSHPIS